MPTSSDITQVTQQPSRRYPWHTRVRQQALNSYNRYPNSSGFAPIFLALGISREESPGPYVPELTLSEEAALATDLVKIQNPRIQNARLNVANGKAARDEIRSYLQEKKAQLRIFGKGDWVLRQRNR